MTINSNTIRGVVHGKMIELDEDTGLPDGQHVRVTVQPVTGVERGWPPGEGIRRSAGAWADDPQGLDKYLEWSRLQRKISRPLVEE